MKQDLYSSLFGCECESAQRLDQAGSSRKYTRLYGNPTVILTEGESKLENDAFIYLSKLFSSHSLPVPDILCVDDDGYRYLQSDLGDVSLYSMIVRYGIESREVVDVYSKLMARLPEFHFGFKDIDLTKLYPRKSMDSRAAMWDLNYFKYCFLKAIVEEFDEDKLEDDLQLLADDVTFNPEDALMLRDLQSRNIMVCDTKPFVIDFQGARRGSCVYDIASLLWQPRAGIPHHLRENLIAIYLDSASKMDIEIVDFRNRLNLMVLFRTLQVLGAYGFRGYFQRKSQFLSSIVPAVNNLRDCIDNISFESYPYLISLLKHICDLPRFKTDKHSKLRVNVCSFSYKKGIPDDYTGNGGGFVFDCRAVHNPGRYPEYKSLTGLDAPVIDFLHNYSEISAFLNSCYALVDASVEKYLERGFTDIMVCFGCTGGHHRSVYSAQAMAEHLNDKYGVEVLLNHREQDIIQLLPAK